MFVRITLMKLKKSDPKDNEKLVVDFHKLVLGLNEFVNIVERQGHDQIFNV